MTTTIDIGHDAPGLHELADRLIGEEPPELRALRTGSLARQIGSYGQYFTTWDFANGILRDYAMNLYQLLRQVTDGQLAVDAARAVLRSWQTVYAEYLADSGFTALGHHARAVASDPPENRDAFVDRLSALVAYLNRLVAWSHQSFPWHLGERCRYPATAGEPAHAPVSAATPRGIPVRLSWEPLAIAVEARLSDANERLRADVLAALPFTVLQSHAVVTGESMYAWTPLVSVAPTPVIERICDAPVGRLRFSQATGNKLVVQYGRTTETLSAPVLGEVVPRDLALVAQVGRAAWESTFRTKDRIWLTVEAI